MRITPMTDEQKLEANKSYRDISFAGLESSERRGGELADEFTRLEVQIATILFALAGVFLQPFIDYVSVLPHVSSLVLKSFYSASIFSLILSLTLGLIHLKRKEKFWDEMMNQRQVRLKKWLSAIKGDVTYEEAWAFHEGTALEKGNKVSTPIWTWVLQTISLGIAVVLMLLLTFIFIF